MIVPGGHPSNYGQGPALLNFSDRADTDELAPYSLHNDYLHVLYNVNEDFQLFCFISVGEGNFDLFALIGHHALKPCSVTDRIREQYICYILCIQTDRQIFYWFNKSQYRLLCHKYIYIYLSIFKMVSKVTYTHIHGIAYIIKIMLSGTDMIKH